MTGQTFIRYMTWTVALSTAVPLAATVLVTVDEAMELAFPGSVLDRQTLFLTDEERATAESMAGVELAGAMVTRFIASVNGETVGYGYLDTHRVRTLAETVLVMVDPAGTIRRVETVSFREPLDYLPPDGWYRQFDGEKLTGELAMKRTIRPITGATLTARSTTAAVRRMLAVHAITTGGGGPG